MAFFDGAKFSAAPSSCKVFKGKHCIWTEKGVIKCLVQTRSNARTRKAPTAA